MIKFKKLGLTTLGTLAIAAPIATVVSCQDDPVHNSPINGRNNRHTSTKEKIIEYERDFKINDNGYSNHYSNPKFSDIFKLSDTNTMNNDLIKDGKIKSLAEIQKTKASFGKKTILNITLNDDFQKYIMNEYKKDKTIFLDENNKKMQLALRKMKLKIHLDKLVDGNFFQNKINSKEDAENISKQIQELEKNNQTHVAFNFEMPKSFNMFEDIEFYIEGAFGDNYNHTGWSDVPSFSNTYIEGVKDNTGKITSLKLRGLSLDTFDQTKFPKGLKNLDLYSNFLTSVDLSKTSIETLNLAANHTMASWKQLQITSSMPASTLDLNNVKFPSTLKDLNFSHNWKSSLNLQALPPTLEKLNILDNPIVTLNTQELPSKLTDLNASATGLITFDATQLPSSLVNLNLKNNSLSTFDATQLPSTLVNLNITNNQLRLFDATHLPSTLESLDVSHNKMDDFNATHLPPTLKILNVGHNNLAVLDASSLPSGIEELYFFDNGISTLNISTLPKSLKTMNWSNNLFTDDMKKKLQQVYRRNRNTPSRLTKAEEARNQKRKRNTDIIDRWQRARYKKTTQH